MVIKYGFLTLNQRSPYVKKYDSLLWFLTKQSPSPRTLSTSLCWVHKKGFKTTYPVAGVVVVVCVMSSGIIMSGIARPGVLRKHGKGEFCKNCFSIQTLFYSGIPS